MGVLTYIYNELDSLLDSLLSGTTNLPPNSAVPPVRSGERALATEDV